MRSAPRPGRADRRGHRRPRLPRPRPSGRYRHRTLRTDEGQRIHVRHPRPQRRLLGRPRPGLRHRRPLHRRRHRPRERPAHRRDRYRRGDPRRAGRHPRQGHSQGDGHHPHHQSAAQREVGPLQGPEGARRRPPGRRHLRARRGRVRGTRRTRRRHLRPRRDLGRGQAAAAGREGERREPRRREDHPRHLPQPARTPRGRPGAETATGEGRIPGHAGGTRVLAAGERRRHRRADLRPHPVARRAPAPRRAARGGQRLGGARRAARVPHRVRPRHRPRRPTGLAARPRLVRPPVDGAARPRPGPARRRRHREAPRRPAARRSRRTVGAGRHRTRTARAARRPPGDTPLSARTAAEPRPVRGRPHRRSGRGGADLRHPRPRPHHPPGRPRPGPARPPGRHAGHGPAGRGDGR